MSDLGFFTDFTGDIEEILEDCRQKIEEAIDWVCDTWDDTVDTWKQAISPAFAYLVHRAADKLEDAFQTIWDEFSSFCVDLWNEIDRMAGGPFELMNMNDAYTNAAAHLRDEAEIVERIKDRVADHWGGDAADAFNDVMVEQNKAMLAVDRGLTKAASACAAGALQIRSIWRDVIDTLLSIVSKILECIKDGTDAGQWVSLDTGPLIRFFGEIFVKVAELGNQLERYFDRNATVDLGMWQDLNVGLAGLQAGNTWPDIASSDRRDLNDPGAWPTPA